jgi:pyruvate dehydrogenase E2 component (dihydrolipoamide acetyltransferase)
VATTRDFLLPDLGEGLTEAEILRWLVEPGDLITLNQPVVEVETEKAAVEIPSPFEGEVVSLHGEPGERIPVGRPLITIRLPGMSSTADAPSERRDVLVGYGPEAGTPRRSRVRIRQPPPKQATAPSDPREERIPLRSIRRAMAEKMVRSVRTIPHATEWLQVDATELVGLMNELRRAPDGAGVKVTPVSIVVKALTIALQAHPLINSSLDDARGEIVVRRAYHVGIAVDTTRGLIVPVVRDADRHPILALAREVARLAAAARDGSIRPDEVTGSTITVTSVGSLGIEAGNAIINHPEAAVLAAGAIVKRPWVVGDAVVPRDVMTLALTFDHRIIDGAEAGRFLRDLADLIEDSRRALSG